MIINLPLKLQYRPNSDCPWVDSDWGPLDHDLADQVLWMARNGYDSWCEYRLIIA